MITSQKMKNCQQCSSEFEPLNQKAKYCSDACRKAANRDKNRDDDSPENGIVTQKEVHLAGNPDNPVIVTLPRGVYEKDGKYWYQEKEVTQEGLELLRELEKNPTAVYDRFTALQLFAMGITPPKWKRTHRTRQEALQSIEKALDEMGLVQNEKGFWVTEDEKEKQNTDYSTWQ